MERIVIPPRVDWIKKVEALGLVYHHTKGKPYWWESAYYQFSEEEVLNLERWTGEMWRICLEAVQNVIDRDRFAELAIPSEFVPLIKQSWEDDPPFLYGRFDLSYDGRSPAKLLEFNADTPTTLLEASVVQWHWLEEQFMGFDQFNSIHEKLVARWKLLAPRFRSNLVHFAHAEETEDLMTVMYLRDTAQQAGINTAGLHIHEIHWDKDRQIFVGLDNEPMETIFKLYPWEWMVREEYGDCIIKSADRMQWIEPIWKMVLSNKGILPVLWELFPGHPNLLEAYFDEPRDMKEYVKKPLLAREGANITIVSKDESLEETEGSYGEPFVYQAFAPLPNFDGARPVVGSWVIDDEPAGIGIRESDGPVTTNISRFVPHLFK